MVHLYTRVNDKCDVIMVETDGHFETSIRNRFDIFDSFKPIVFASFKKENENAEILATGVYDKFLEDLNVKDEL
jgi:hypothetical protein